MNLDPPSSILMIRQCLRNANKHCDTPYKHVTPLRIPSSTFIHHRRNFSRTATTSRTTNAAHLAQVEAASAKSNRIVQLVEKRVKLHQQLVAQLETPNDAEYSEHVNRIDKIKASKTIKELEPLVAAWKTYTENMESIKGAIQLMEDPDEVLRSMAEEELAASQSSVDSLIQEVFPKLLIPKSQTAENGAVVEIKAGAGGEEAGLFAADLFRMYTRYVDAWGADISARGAEEGGRGLGRGWKTNVLSQSISASMSGKDAFKEVVFEVEGRGAYDSLRWENGVHRVQRVPATETSGRMHTSAAAVVVLPLMEEKPAETSAATFFVDEKDVKVEVMRARGAGGQHVNKTESAVRLTHIPTGITVSMQDSRSQHANKAYAWKILRSRLFDLKLRQEAEENRKTRRTLVKGMDRSDKIRTYNYVQDRITDHRSGFTIMNLESVMDGEGLERVIESCRKMHEEEIISTLLEE